MIRENKLLGRIGIVSFILGLLLGMMLLGIAVMGDFEGYVFHPQLSGDAVLKTLKCPVMMDVTEVKTITATIPNPTDGKLTPAVWTHISEGFVTLLREERDNFTLQPGESGQVSWTVTGDDAAYGHWILVKVYVYSQYPLPSSIGYCGVYVADLKGFTGDQVFTFSFILSLVLIGVGFVIWVVKNRLHSSQRSRKWIRYIQIMGGMTVVGLLLISMGSHLMIFSAALFTINLLAITTFILRKLDSP